MGRVTQRLTLLNLLVEEGQRVLQMRRLLLVEWRHAELLVNQSLVLAARGSVAVMRVVAEGGFVQVAKVGHNRVHTSKEALIL